MIYLTEAKIDYETAALARLTDPSTWHKAAWQAFAWLGPEAKRSFLTRIDPMPGFQRLLVVSEQEPHRPDWCPEATWRSQAVPEDKFFSSQRYAFRLRANPTKVPMMDDSGQKILQENRGRKPLVNRSDLEAWLIRKGVLHGFTVDVKNLETLRAPRERFAHRSKKRHADYNVTLNSVDFRGVLTVTDLALLKDAFRLGIGRAKGFGFGLLALAPLAN